MTSYVDDTLRDAALRNGAHHVHGRWSRLLADDTAELFTVAAALGLRRAWLQAAGTPAEHFEISAGKRLTALERGAFPLTATEADHLIQAKRAGVPFEIELLRTDPDHFETLLRAATSALNHPPPTGGPHRVQLARTPGFALPPGTVSVTAPSPWANPHRPATRTAAAHQAAVDHFRHYLARNPTLIDRGRTALTGLNLACTCPPTLPCHADVWLALANPSDGGL